MPLSLGTRMQYWMLRCILSLVYRICNHPVGNTLLWRLFNRRECGVWAIPDEPLGPGRRGFPGKDMALVNQHLCHFPEEGSKQHPVAPASPLYLPNCVLLLTQSTAPSP